MAGTAGARSSVESQTDVLSASISATEAAAKAAKALLDAADAPTMMVHPVSDRTSPAVAASSVLPRCSCH